MEFIINRKIVLPKTLQAFMHKRKMILGKRINLFPQAIKEDG